jgi:hypothetical protein
MGRAMPSRNAVLVVKIRHLSPPPRPQGQSRGRGAAADVCGNLVAHRPATGAARSGMTGRSGQMQQTTTAEVRLDQGKAVRFGFAKPSASPFWLSTGLLRSNSVAAHLAETEYRANRPGIRRMLGYRKCGRRVGSACGTLSDKEATQASYGASETFRRKIRFMTDCGCYVLL